MARMRVAITDFTGGMVSRKVAGRLDVPFQQKSAEEIEGFLVCPDGGVKRRRGTYYITEPLGIPVSEDGLYGDASVPAFVIVRTGEVGSEVPYMVWIENSPRALKALNLQTGAATVTELGALEAGKPLRKTQTFYSETDADPSNQNIHLCTPGHSFTVNVSTWAITERATWNEATVFQNRLIVADSTWGILRMSIPLEMLDFTLTEEVAIPGTDPVEFETVATGAIEAYPDFYGAEKVTWLTSRQSLYIGTNKGEYEVISAYPYYSNDPGGVRFVRVSSIGTEDAQYLGPYMVVSKNERLIRVQWSGEHVYQTQSITEYLDNAKVIKHLTIEEGSLRYLFMLDIDRNLYCLTESPGAEVSGWSKIATDVWWIEEYDKTLAIAKPTETGFRVELLPLEVVWWDTTESWHHAYRANYLHADWCGYLTVGAAAIVGHTLPPSSTVKVYKYTGGAMVYVDDVDTDASGDLDDSLANIQDLVGYTDTPVELFCFDAAYTFTSRVKTLPIHIPTAAGTALGKLKQIHGVVIVVHESMALQARVNGEHWETWSSDTPYSGVVPLTLETASADTVQVEVQAVGEFPLNIMSIEVDVTVGEL